MPGPTVFISSATEDLPTARALGQLLEPHVSVLTWPESAFHVGWSALESLTQASDEADFAIFVVGPADSSESSIHQNQVFELGFLAGRLGAQRIFLFDPQPARSTLPSDLAGFLRLGPELSDAVASIRKGINRIGPRFEETAEFYSCFISYAYSDQDFANRLHADLQEMGVRSWLDANEIRPGDRIYEAIDRAVRVHDKLLLVLSESSVNSPWVRREIDIALQLEQGSNRTVLFPVRLDDSVFKSKENTVTRLVRDRHIADFRDWRVRNSYRRSFSRLIHDLTIRASVESEPQR